MKNVWILNHYAQEPGSFGGTRHFDLAKHLREFGWKASIIAAGTELNTGRQRLAAGENHRLDTFDGIDFLWLATPAYQGNGLGRLRNMATYAVRALGKSTAPLPPPDAVIGSSVHPLAAWAGLRLASRFNVPFFFEVRDLWPETLIDMGTLSRNHPAAIAMRMLEGRLYRGAEKIISLLPHAHRYIRRFDISEDKIAWLPNGIDLDRFPSPPPPLPAETFMLMYFGAHGGANGLDNVIAAMRLLGDQPVRLRLIGDGPSKTSLVEAAAGLANVSFEPPVPKDAIPALAAQADAFVFNLIDAPVFNYGISSNKLFDFMASGRPTLFCSSASNNPIADASGGITVQPGKPAALADAIRQLLDTPLTVRQTMGTNAREYIEKNHDFRSLARKLADILP
ncbi:Glycosyl transferase [uncultured Sphingopyxis sp.]|uniref:Glycosyl transferase n=1 Tax=uncultured Sphingopyxis sp. TaxID=310581 RepID=A0A1Y5PVQ9_9SPHN|nr:glycosyltransferase family 4 protein [uncultured Sphingopyxis sp.]SBV32766.1 Glycosyl transferase [uncultured Sphingopyxis sp.]